jgi:hypothetical protein
MKSLLLAAILLFSPACTTVPEGVDTILDVRDGDVASMAAWLGTHRPASLPVLVLSVPLLQVGLFGETYPDGDHYTVLIDPSLDPQEQAMVLMHEWAHVLVMDSGDQDSSSHGPLWGLAYSDIYREWVGENSPAFPDQ